MMREDPTIGMIRLDCQVLTSENLTERLVVFTPIPGTEDADRLALLAVVGTQDLGAPEALLTPRRSADGVEGTE